MLRFAVRAERAWAAVPAVVRLLAVIVAAGALLALSVGSAVAASHADPFRWD